MNNYSVFRLAVLVVDGLEVGATLCLRAIIMAFSVLEMVAGGGQSFSAMILQSSTNVTRSQWERQREFDRQSVYSSTFRATLK